MHIAPSYCRISGNEVKEDQEATKFIENALKVQASSLCFPGKLFSNERAERCYQLALENLLNDRQLKISLFLSQKFITFMSGTQDEASILKFLPKDVFKVILFLNINFLLPSYEDYRNKFMSENNKKILSTNDYVLSLMNGPLPKITYS